MKVKLKDLKPNPYKRHINQGKMDPEKISRLLESINQTGFWEGICGRKNPEGQIEIAFGHHRLAAAKKKYGADHEINIKIMPLDDGMMLQMLANENNIHDEASVQAQIDVVKQVKKYLKLRCPPDGHLSNRSKSQRDGQGIGFRQISEFLGVKNWSKSKIEELFRIDDQLAPEISRKLMNIQEGTSTSKGLSRAVGICLSKLKSKDDQKRLAKVIEKENLGKRDVENIVWAINIGSPELKRKAKAVKNLKDCRQVETKYALERAAARIEKAGNGRGKKIAKALREAVVIQNLYYKTLQIAFTKCMSIIHDPEIAWDRISKKDADILIQMHHQIGIALKAEMKPRKRLEN